MINPRHISMQRWCAAMVDELRAFGQVAPLAGEDWQAWSRQVLTLPGLARYNPPNPEGFDRFEDWADRFNGAVPV